jgi:hypothetical protein
MLRAWNRTDSEACQAALPVISLKRLADKHPNATVSTQALSEFCSIPDFSRASGIFGVA